MMNQYVNILEESLKQKIEVLKELEQADAEEMAMLKAGKLSFDGIDSSLEKKTALMEKLEQLDEGFETVYDRVREELQGNKGQYAEQIGRMQAMIQEITDRVAAIQAAEKRNKVAFGNQVTGMRKDMQKGMKNTKTVANYYQNAGQGVNSIYMDEKH